MKPVLTRLAIAAVLMTVNINMLRKMLLIDKDRIIDQK